MLFRNQYFRYNTKPVELVIYMLLKVIGFKRFVHRSDDTL